MMVSLPEVTDVQRAETREFWRRHEEHLRSHNLASEEGLRWVAMCTKPDCIGYDSMKGHIRPGKIGRWDLLEILKMSGLFNLELCQRLAGISDLEAAKAERDLKMHYAGLDPKNPSDVKLFERHGNMTPEELDDEIAELEGKLKLKPSPRRKT